MSSETMQSYYALYLMHARTLHYAPRLPAVALSSGCPFSHFESMCTTNRKWMALIWLNLGKKKLLATMIIHSCLFGRKLASVDATCQKMQIYEKAKMCILPFSKLKNHLSLLHESVSICMRLRRAQGWDTWNPYHWYKGENGTRISNS